MQLTYTPAGGHPPLRGMMTRLAARSALWLLVTYAATGCAEPVPVKNEVLDSPRYVRYTLRSQPSGLQQLSYRSNFLSFPIGYKVGSKVSFPFYSSQRVDLSFNGVPCSMYYKDVPFPTEPEGLKKFIEKHFATTEEELNLAALDKSTREQIDRGIAAIGMTKEQVFLALGYPAYIGPNWVPADDLARAQIFESTVWHYRYNEIMWIPSWYSYQFNNDGIFVQRSPP